MWRSRRRDRYMNCSTERQRKTNVVKTVDEASAAAGTAKQTCWLLKATNKSIKHVLGRQEKLDSLPLP